MFTELHNHEAAERQLACGSLRIGLSKGAGNMLSIVLKNDEGQLLPFLSYHRQTAGTRPLGLWCDGDGLRGALVPEVIERYESED